MSFRSILDDFGKGTAHLLRWPPANGGFTVGFSAGDAEEIAARGYVMWEGLGRCRVVDVDPDEPRIISFQAEHYEERDGTPLEIERRAA